MAATEEPQLERRVVDDEAQHRYVIYEGDDVAGFTQYRRRPGLIAFIHTEIDERREGRGLGGELIGTVLEQARERGDAVLPFCPFVNDYIKRHREFAALVPESYRAEFGL